MNVDADVLKSVRLAYKQHRVGCERKMKCEQQTSNGIAANRENQNIS